MKLTPVPESAAFPLSAKQRDSFAGRTARPYRIGGPPGLVRLRQRDRGKLGDYWFEEPVFNRLRDQAKKALARQASENGRPFSKPINELVGMYMRLCLRSDLAICKDWTEDFDGYVILPLGSGDEVVAWVGPIATQPYFSEPQKSDPDYEEKKATHDLASKAGIVLLGSENQYVINFNFPPNQKLITRLREHWSF